MFFSGDASARKRVNLGGKSSKERDLQVLLEQHRQERKRRLGLRQQNAAAIKIQKCYRGRKSVARERSRIREQFMSTSGDYSKNVDLSCFSPNSTFLRQLLFFFRANNLDDFGIFVETCQKLLQLVRTGEFMSIMAGKNYAQNHAIVDHRLKQLSFFCLQAVHENRHRLKEQLLLSEKNSSMPTIILLETVVALANPELPWADKVIEYLEKRKAFSILRDIIIAGMDSRKTLDSPGIGCATSVERVIIAIVSCDSKDPCCDPYWSFSSQILSVPFLWHHFTYLKEAIATTELGKRCITHIAANLHSSSNVLPGDISHEFPGCACLLGNLLEIAGSALSQPIYSHSMVVDFTVVASYLLEVLPPTRASIKDYFSSENEMDIDGEDTELLNPKLEKQISDAMDPFLLEHLVSSLFGETSETAQSLDDELSDEELTSVGAICSFLYTTFCILPLERIMTVLAYRTEIVHILWKFIKRCHAHQQWSSLSKLTSYLSQDSPGWLLPLAVFCPVYKHMLMIIDNEEFYEQEKPLQLKDIKFLIIILRQVLWEILWLNPGNSPSVLPKGSVSIRNKLSIDTVKNKAKLVISELLSQLQDWNNRHPFTSFSDFHAQEAVGEAFISQALLENTRAQDVLKLAPFLVPFTSRVKIFASQLRAARQRDGDHPAFTRYRFKIRRNQIFEDAFNQLRLLSEEELRGMIRVSFINEVGAEEVGIDGGGIFKDFMESITRAAFDVQYGLFKETTDHLLYPNPGSAMMHGQHLQFFHFLGTILGKAMFEGILVEIPFARFFLSKLKQKYNYLNDLPSLDQELYRHLLFLKHYKGDVADLELYFVVVNNDFGEQIEEELLHGGKNIRVTKDNVITFIHLVANYRLNSQIRHQSSHFLRGFQQLIKKEWIDMFDEHEIQLLISGSLDGMDVNDLQSNVHYSGGYHQDHHVIKMFWEVIKSFTPEHQKKFLKFVTGCSRGPLLGFKHLEPKFCIQRAAPSNPSEADLDRLPTSATCINLLKLPPYTSKDQMQTKLLYAINAEAGFDLS